jgi:hypothetical protein
MLFRWKYVPIHHPIIPIISSHRMTYHRVAWVLFLCTRLLIPARPLFVGRCDALGDLLTTQAKRFSREAKEKEVREITDSKHTVFAGQVLAEMLAAICHKEFFGADQEVHLLSPVSLYPWHPG